MICETSNTKTVFHKQKGCKRSTVRRTLCKSEDVPSPCIPAVSTGTIFLPDIDADQGRILFIPQMNHTRLFVTGQRAPLQTRWSGCFGPPRV